MNRIIPIEIDPVTITTMDRKERKLLLLTSGANRVMRKYDAKSLPEAWAKGGDASVITTLYEAVLEKEEGLTEEKFADIMPYNPKAWADILTAVMQNSMPPNPTKAAEPTGTLAAIQ